MRTALDVVDDSDESGAELAQLARQEYTPYLAITAISLGASQRLPGLTDQATPRPPRRLPRGLPSSPPSWPALLAASLGPLFLTFPWASSPHPPSWLQEHIAFEDELATVTSSLAKCEKLLRTPIPLGYTRYSVRFLSFLSTASLCTAPPPRSLP